MMGMKFVKAARTLVAAAGRRAPLGAVSCSLALALVACGPASDEPREDSTAGEVSGLEKTNLTLALIPISETLAIAAAQEQGFFEDVGLTVEVQRVGSGAEAMPLLAGGRVDLIFSNTVTTLQAIEEGLDAVFLTPAGWARKEPPDTSSAVMVRSDAGIGDPSELAGKRVATNVIGSIAWLYFAEWLNQNGVPPDEVTFAEIPFPQMVDALLGGGVDAIFPPDPFRTIAEETGQIDSLGYGLIEVQPGVEISQYIAQRSWVEEHPNTAAAFTSAVRKGSAFINENEAEARDINVRWTGLSEDLKEEVEITRLGTETNVESIRMTMDLMIEYGLIENEIDVEQHLAGIDQ